MTNRVEFTIHGQPVGKGRPRFRRLPTGFIMAYTPAKTAHYEQRVRSIALLAMEGSAAMGGPVSIRVEINMEVPKSWSKKKRADSYSGKIFPTKRPDIDNIAKTILDGLNGVLFFDDSRITDLIVTKRFSAIPCVKVIASQIEGVMPA